MSTRNEPTNWIRLILSITLAAGLTTSVVPVLSAGGNEALRDRTRVDCARIAAALTQAIHDTDRTALQTEHRGWLLGDGAIAEGIDASAATTRALNDHLVSGAGAAQTGEWQGPYMMSVNPDAWGNAYAVDAASLRTDGTTWVISAGPDGVLETSGDDAETRGDDIGVRVRL